MRRQDSYIILGASLKGRYASAKGAALRMNKGSLVSPKRVKLIGLFSIVLALLCSCESNQHAHQKRINPALTDSFELEKDTVQSLVKLNLPKLINDPDIYAFINDYINHTKEITLINPVAIDYIDTNDLKKHISSLPAPKPEKNKRGEVLVEWPPKFHIKKADYYFMLCQMKQNKDAKWDNNKIIANHPVRLCTYNKDTDVVSISVPLYTQDRKSVLLEVDNTLIGGIRLFTFHHGRWVDDGNKIPFDWIH